MTDTMMTITGNVVDTPKLRRTKNGYFVASLRVASTSRRFDREQNRWVDRDTLFVTVTCWRALGENVAQSLHKGQPVVVYGRYCQHEYEQDETLRTAYELEAVAIGHDLTRGVTRFEKVFRPGPVASVDLDEQGVPVDHTADYHELVEDPPADDRPVAEVDLQTGEVRELAPAG